MRAGPTRRYCGVDEALGPAVALLAALPAFGCGGAGGGDPDGGSSDADAGPSVAVAVTAGSYHSCALTSEGGIKCWGGNWHGSLGIGNLSDEGTSPLDVLGFESGAVDVSAGSAHTCAVDADGGVKCWGEYKNGQLGNGMGADVNEECVESDDCLMPTPVDVVGFGQ
ncbi:MAG: hypothetical protein R6V85_04755 [Polyangia bacterium]